MINKNAAGLCWLTAQLCFYLAGTDVGANRATFGQLVYDENRCGHVTADTVANGVARRFGNKAPPLASIKRQLSTLYACNTSSRRTLSRRAPSCRRFADCVSLALTFDASCCTAQAGPIEEH